MDQLLITVLSGVANGAVYGLVGLGLVIIFQSTDVMNFAMAAMATTASYVALSMVRRRAWRWRWRWSIAVVFASLFGLAVREVLIRPLGEGRLFAALVVTMGVAISTEHFVGRHWGEQPEAFPRLVDGTVSLGGSRIHTQDLLDHRRRRRRDGRRRAACSRVRRSARPCAQSPSPRRPPGCSASTPRRSPASRGPWASGSPPSAWSSTRPTSGLTPVVLAPVLFRAFAGILLGGLTSMTGAVVGGLVIGVLDNLAATYVSASFRDTFVFSVAVLVLLVRPQGMFGRQAFVRV